MVRELARRVSKQACQRSGVQWLDDTVFCKRRRLCRNARGHVQIYREYRFEFSSDGEERYQGLVCLCGKYVQQVELEVFRVKIEP